MISFRRTTDICPIKRNFAEAIFGAGKFLEDTGWGEGASLGYRHALGFVVTKEGATMGTITDKDLVFVECWDAAKDTLNVRGSVPPTEDVWIHAAVYQNRSSAIYTILVPNPKLREAALVAKIPALSGEHPRGSSVWFEAVQSLLGSGNRMVVSKMGVLSLGCTVEDAIKLLR